MSREIKFRVWEEREKAYNTWTFILDTLGNLFRNVYGALIGCNEKDYIIEQDTGLKDRNGKMIREGDVVKCWDDENGEVYFCDISLQYRVKFANGDDEDLASCEAEVIGNIHENPELLGGEEC